MNPKETNIGTWIIYKYNIFKAPWYWPLVSDDTGIATTSECNVRKLLSEEPTLTLLVLKADTKKKKGKHSLRSLDNTKYRKSNKSL